MLSIRLWKIKIVDIKAEEIEKEASHSITTKAVEIQNERKRETKYNFDEEMNKEKKYSYY